MKFGTCDYEHAILRILGMIHCSEQSDFQWRGSRYFRQVIILPKPERGMIQALCHRRALGAEPRARLCGAVLHTHDIVVIGPWHNDGVCTVPDLRISDKI